MKTKQMNQENILQDVEKQSKPKHTVWTVIKNHPTISILLLGILGIISVLVWKNIENDRQKTKTINLATQAIEMNQIDLVKVMAKPLVWSIRSEMLRGNMEQVNILITDMVKEKNFLYIHIIAPDGIVVLSTNKGLEGKPVGNAVDSTLLIIESRPMALLTGTTLVVTSPVMGVDRRLATLVLGYKTTKLNLEK